jgi:ABC-type sugar transport system permease subunit
MREASPDEDTRALVMTAYEMADSARRKAGRAAAMAWIALLVMVVSLLGWWLR